MATDNLINNDVIIKLNDNFIPQYSPLYAVFLGSNAKKSDEKVGKIEYRSVSTVGDIVAKDVTTQDTELSQVVAGQKIKTFNKFFKGIEYVQSGYQDDEIQPIINITLSHLMKQEDKEFVNGDRNNGLFNSFDPDYIEAATAGGTAPTNYATLKAFVRAMLEEANDLGGEAHLLIPYGDTAKNLLEQEVSASDRTPLYKALEQDLQERIVVKFAPSKDIFNIAANQSGFLLVTPTACSMNYTTFSKVDGEGYDARRKSTWITMSYGSKNLEILGKGGVVKRDLDKNF